MVIKKARKGMFGHGKPICDDLKIFNGDEFHCTRKRGHKGKHRSGIGNNEYNHEW